MMDDPSEDRAPSAADGVPHDRAPLLVRRSSVEREPASGRVGRQDADRTGPRRATRVALRWAAGILLTAVVGVSVSGASLGTNDVDRALPPAPEQPPVGQPQPQPPVDVDGDGAPDDLTVERAAIVVTSGSRAGRYRLGEPSDRIVVADVDCDGVATPLVHRPAAGRLYLFDEWPGAEPVAPRVVDVPVGEPLKVRAGDGCHRLAVAGRAIR